MTVYGDVITPQYCTYFPSASVLQLQLLAQTCLIHFIDVDINRHRPTEDRGNCASVLKSSEWQGFISEMRDSGSSKVCQRLHEDLCEYIELFCFLAQFWGCAAVFTSPTACYLPSLHDEICGLDPLSPFSFSLSSGILKKSVLQVQIKQGRWKFPKTPPSCVLVWTYGVCVSVCVGGCCVHWVCLFIIDVCVSTVNKILYSTVKTCSFLHTWDKYWPMRMPVQGNIHFSCKYIEHKTKT